MSRTVELVPIAATPTSLGLNYGEVDIEISVLTLIFLYIVYKLLDLFLKVGAILS